MFIASGMENLTNVCEATSQSHDLDNYRPTHRKVSWIASSIPITLAPTFVVLLCAVYHPLLGELLRALFVIYKCEQKELPCLEVL